ncbi:c6 zinc finger domain containing protein [Grosmannia clavigera kw1407]|uniref:C6 zinc finger domain containing protein n=1 Tax=Grosmannia clavigera (strain kw1407 / UAMH 11150) TaxID=655863 RepID=F0XT80_GROCL|nr:c6 zinc finger domain containing protein [Grosmannia clavigera kw1407]EFW99102.1 c6 zinc finger domain containing protein [Grosmannia clavigera kw1407]
MSAQRPRRLLRVSKACDFCHKRRIKCQENPAGGNRCQNCAEFDIPCTYARPSRRGRGSPPPPGHSDVGVFPSRPDGQLYGHSHHQRTMSGDDMPTRSSHVSAHGDGNTGSSTDEGDCAVPTEPLSPTWQAFAHTVTPALKRLFAIYHETVYPIFPFFDPVRVERRLEMLEHVRSRAFFCSVMAACALASARARDGALSTDGSSAAPASTSTAGTPGSSRSGCTTTSAVDLPAAVFLAAAEEALPHDMLQCQDFDYLRGCALLAIASIQDAKIASMHKYIGLYFTLMAVNQWHDEANWPARLHAAEIEERRRLYWSIYTLDVYSSIIWDGCIHFQESHARVAYPTGQSELPPWSGLSPASPPLPASASAPAPSWMVGWNFTTDLYRVLEHNLSRLRSRSSRFALAVDGDTDHVTGDTAATSTSMSTSTSPKRRPFRASSSQDRVAAMYATLPAVFKQLQPATGEPARDVYGFQAANIQATLGLLQMVHLSLDADAASLEQRCAVVHDVLQIFHRVPTSYLRAISTPFIYHIGGIGAILGSVMEGLLSEASCCLIRELLLSMAGLLESLEAFLHRSAGAGQRLRNLVARLEAYVASQRLPPSLSTENGPGNGPGNGRRPRRLSISSVALDHRQQDLLPTPPPVQTLAPLMSVPMVVNTSPGPASGPTAVVSIPVNSPTAVYHQNNAGSWVPSAAAPSLPPDLNQQFQLPDEILQDWTWPFAASNSYLSF